MLTDEQKQKVINSIQKDGFMVAIEQNWEDIPDSDNFHIFRTIFLEAKIKILSMLTGEDSHTEEVWKIKEQLRGNVHSPLRDNGQGP